MSRRIVSPASIAGRSDGIAATCLVNESSCRRSTSYAVAAMKSPIVSKWRNRAPTDTPARLVITAADARAYPTSTMLAIQASRSRPTVSSRRCCCVLAISGSDFDGALGCRPLLTGPQVAARLHGLSVTVAELAGAEDHGAAHTRRNHGVVVAIDHAPQATVEGHRFLVVTLDRLVQSGRVDHREIGAVALAQGAGVDAEPLGQFTGQAMHR